tara:strand:- start:9 stop:914 length:906 start_codon:yes stop_codon:yes gene_type:complete
MKDNFISRLIRWYKRPKSFFVDLVESLIVIVPVVFLIKTFVFGLYQVPTCSMETTMLVGERFFADKLTPYFSKPKRGEIISFNDPNYMYSDSWLMNMYQQYVDWNVVNYTKRVIGIPGDKIKGTVEEGKPVIYLNGQKLDEPYLNKYPIMSVFKPSSPMLRVGVPGEIVRRSYDPSVSYEDQPFYRFNKLEVTLAKKYSRDNNIFYPNTPASNGFSSLTKDEYEVELGPNQYWMMGDNRQGSSDSRDWGVLDTTKVTWHGRILFRIWSLDSDESWWIVDLLRHPIDFWKRVRWSRFFQVLR